ncbi:MAG: serine/threonine-protein kinase [Acidimicrobiales bacterium]
MEADDEGVPDDMRMVGGRYELGEVIGRGGMGDVRAGVDRRLDRAVAVKLLRADMAHQVDVRRRFEDEALLAARLVHPHVVSVFDTGEEGGIPYLVMERLSGRNLAEEIARGPMDPEAVRALGLQVLDALAAAHAAGLVHRDVKPGNILATTPGCWKVGDFGIAKSLEVSDSSVTVAGMIIGTPGYLAPERLAGGPATVSSDLYAAGVVLYEALSGRRLVEPGAPLTALLTATPPDIRALRSDVPIGMATLVMRAIAREPAERFKSATEMAEALRANTAVTYGEPTIAVHPLRSDEAGPQRSTTRLITPALTDPVSPRRQWARAQIAGPRRRLMAAAAAVAVILVAMMIVISTGGAHHQTPPASASNSPGLGTLPGPLDAALKELERQVRP